MVFFIETLFNMPVKAKRMEKALRIIKTKQLISHCFYGVFDCYLKTFPKQNHEAKKTNLTTYIPDIHQ